MGIEGHTPTCRLCCLAYSHLASFLDSSPHLCACQEWYLQGFWGVHLILLQLAETHVKAHQMYETVGMWGAAENYFEQGFLPDIVCVCACAHIRHTLKKSVALITFLKGWPITSQKFKKYWFKACHSFHGKKREPVQAGMDFYSQKELVSLKKKNKTKQTPSNCSY